MLKVYKEEGVKRDKPFIERDITTKVEQVGYVDTEAQVKRMLYAGETLMRYHRQAYEYPDGEFDVDDVVPDPTLDVGFDPADADLYRRNVEKRLKAAQKKAAAASDKSEAAAYAEKSGDKESPETSALQCSLLI